MSESPVYSQEAFDRNAETMSPQERIEYALALGWQELRAFAKDNEITEEEAYRLHLHESQLSRQHYSRSKAGW